MAKYQAESRFIASIYPGDLEIIVRPHGHDPNPNKGRSTRYWIKPVPRDGKAEVLEVLDAFESILDVAGSAESRRQLFNPRTVDCDNIVRDLMLNWCGRLTNLPQGGSLGIKVIGRSEVPTQADLKEMKEGLSRTYQQWFIEGEQFYRQNDWKSIRKIHRDAAIWLGEKKLWAEPELAAKDMIELIPCMACYELINPNAFVCSKCGVRLKALPPHLQELNPGSDLELLTRPAPGQPAAA